MREQRAEREAFELLKYAALKEKLQNQVGFRAQETITRDTRPETTPRRRRD